MLSPKTFEPSYKKQRPFWPLQRICELESFDSKGTVLTPNGSPGSPDPSLPNDAILPNVYPCLSRKRSSRLLSLVLGLNNPHCSCRECDSKIPSICINPLLPCRTQEQPKCASPPSKPSHSPVPSLLSEPFRSPFLRFLTNLRVNSTLRSSLAVIPMCFSGSGLVSREKKVVRR